MYKENGRLKPDGSKEKSYLKGKKFKCELCGSLRVISNVEFGEINRCTECGGLMIENTTN